MNWTRTLHDITTNADAFDRQALSAAIAHDTVYLPSDLAARLLPLDARRADDVVSWDRSAQAAGPGAPAR